jgi:uncharacterized protein YkwD
MKRVGDILGFTTLAVSTITALFVLIQTPAKPLTHSIKPATVAAASQHQFTETTGLPSPNVVLALVNNERRQRGLAPLQPNIELEQIAQARASDMSKNVYYAHKNSTGGFYDDMMRSKGIITDYSCENLDMSFSEQPTTYVQEWLASNKGHKECMLSPRVTSAGYAIAVLDLPNGQNTKSIVVVAIHSSDIKSN